MRKNQRHAKKKASESNTVGNNSNTTSNSKSYWDTVIN
jgi:hypothetical protein